MVHPLHASRASVKTHRGSHQPLRLTDINSKEMTHLSAGPFAAEPSWKEGKKKCCSLIGRMHNVKPDENMLWLIERSWDLGTIWWWATVC